MRITTAIALAALLLSCPKPPPDAPAKPWGPSEGRPLLEYTFYTTAASRGGESLAYRFSWGDTTTREWTRFYAPGETVSASHRWLVPGTYGVAVRAQTADGGGSEWSSTTTVFINDSVNQRPCTPTQPIGPDIVWMSDEDRCFRSVLTDPDGDTLSVRVDMGAGETTSWYGPVSSGDTVELDLEWDTSGIWRVRFQARDSRGAVSGWSVAKDVCVKRLVEPLWMLYLGSEFSCPAVAADGTIYACSRDGVYALEPGGATRWHRTVPACYRNSVALGPDGTLYVEMAASDSLSSGLRALHPDGSDKWVFPTSKAIIASPIVRTDGGPCFACADSFVYCLDTAGRLRWRTRLALGGGHLYFEPAIGSDGTIYVGALDSLAAIDSSGVLKWRIPLDLPYCAGLAIGSDGTIYGGNPLTAMRPDGSVIWRRDSRSTGAPAIGSDGTIYQPSHDTLFAIGPAGSVKWAFISPCGTSTPAVAADGTVYFADYMPFVHALGPNGRELWRGEDPGSGSEGVTVALGLDGTVLSTACCACLCAFAGTSPLADSPWPKFQRDLSNSGRAGP